MTMMSSLKAFLFATPVPGAVSGSANGVAAPSLAGGDFAALMGGMTPPVADAAAGAALPLPAVVGPVPNGEARALPAAPSSTPDTVLPLSSGAPPVKMALPDAVPVGDAKGTKGRPVAVKDADDIGADAKGAVDLTRVASGDLDEDADAPDADASPDGAVVPDLKPQFVHGDPAVVQAVPAANAPMMDTAAESPREPDNAVGLPGVSKRDAPDRALSRPSSVVADARQPQDVPTRMSAMPDLPVVRGTQPSVEQFPGLTATPVTSTMTEPDIAAMPVVIAQGQAVPATRPVASSGIIASALPVAPTQPLLTGVAPSMVATPQLSAVSKPVLAQAVVGDGVTMLVATPMQASDSPAAFPVDLPAPTPRLPMKSEALSLLQMVRDHFGRPGANAIVDADAPPVATTGPADAKMADPVSADVAIAPAAMASPLAAPTSGVVVSAIQAASGSVDIGGAIAGQVVDMGVQGQWIDGLAKDIAALSAGGAQGRFQIRSDHLGAVQVDIRPSAAGASVSLTVATDAAQQALQADGDRLIADAALAALKITDVRVERGVVTEAARADTAGQNPSNTNGQNQPQNQPQGNAQSVGQGLSQGAGQNRSGHRDGQGDNFAGNHKASGENAVLGQADTRDSEATGTRRIAGRARYA